MRSNLFGLGVLMMATAVSAVASVDTGLIALVPANSTLVAGIDVQKCRSSDFGQFLLSKSQADDEHFEEFMTQTGFDPRRDLDSVVMANSNDNGGKHSPFVILARGNFDQAKISALAVSKGAVAQTYQGVSLLVSNEHGNQVAFAFPDAGVAVMGDLNSIHQVIQNLTTPSTLDVDVMNRINTAGSANDAWFVSATGGAALGKNMITPMTGQNANEAQALKSVRAADGGVKFGSIVTITLDAATRSAQDATSLADVFRFMASMIQMNRQQDSQSGIVASSIDNMQLNTDGDTVHVAFTMSEKNLEQIADMKNPQQHKQQ